MGNGLKQMTVANSGYSYSENKIKNNYLKGNLVLGGAFG